MNNKILIIVDPQNDFIEGGSLPVAGAQKAMDELVQYLRKNVRTYSKIYVTKDYHPKDHCSFCEHGGEWPLHCVQGTDGANVYKPLHQILSHKLLVDNVAYCSKGLNCHNEQYSVFALDENNEITNSAGRIMQEEMAEINNLSVDICGIAGNICVLNTLKDFVTLFSPGKISVLGKYSPSLDDGSELKNYCTENNIRYID